MNQEEWDNLFRGSDRTYQEIRHMLTGVSLFPAHAGKIISLVQLCTMPEAPINPGRKDLVETCTTLLPKPDLYPEVWQALQEANDAVFAPKVD